MLSEISIIYLIAINILTFLLYGIDKLKAKTHRWRIPENVLLLFAAICGSVGALTAMMLFRHKTQHKKFTFCVPFFLLLQLALIIYFLCK